MCDIQLTIEKQATRIIEGVDISRYTPEQEGWWPRLLHYAHLTYITNTPLERAQTYLRDTGSPLAAEGRLLLRAAERALRKVGDTPNGDKQEGDENHG